MVSLALMAVALLAADASSSPNERGPDPLRLDRRLAERSAEGAGEFLLSLEGEHRFAPGDDPARAETDYDDSSWSIVQVPGHRAEWRELATAGAGWYRMRFSLPELPESAELGVNLGIVLHGDEVFLNGERIGGTGEFGENWVEGPWRERVYALPRKWLRSPGVNVIAVRVLMPDPGGIVAGPLGIGEWRSLAGAQEWRARWQRLVEGALLGSLGVSALAAWGALRPAAPREQWLFALFAALVSLAYALDSRWFFELGWKTSLAQRLYYSLAGFIPMAGLAFFGAWMRGRLGPVARALCAANGALGLVALVVPYRWAWLATAPWLVVNAASYVLVLLWGARLWRLGAHEQAPIVIGALLSSTLFVLDCFTVGQEWLYGSLALVGLIAYVDCAGVAMLLRQRRLQDRVHQAAALILTAQEDERRRVARDLHDGVGQLLQSIKLGLSMLQSQSTSDGAPSNQALGELVDESSQAIEEVRRVSMDLRPVFLERRGLLDACQWYARRLADRTDTRIVVVGDPTPALPEMLLVHLYRIFQEALQNVIVHAQASEVEVRLSSSDNRVTLAIRDDGRGFDPAVAPRGVGLASMAERVELLGGNMAIDSRPGQGTRLRFQFPVEDASK